MSVTFKKDALPDMAIVGFWPLVPKSTTLDRKIITWAIPTATQECSLRRIAMVIPIMKDMEITD